MTLKVGCGIGITELFNHQRLILEWIWKERFFVQTSILKTFDWQDLAIYIKFSLFSYFKLVIIYAGKLNN